MLNLAMVVDDPGRKYPDREAIVAGSTRLTYGQLNGLACQVANGLRERGIEPGDRVALSCPNIAYFPIAYFGILKAGAVVVPLNVLFKGGEVAYHLQDSGAKAYLCFEGSSDLPMAQMGHQGASQAPECRDFIVMPTQMGGATPVPDAMSFGELVDGQPTECETADRSPEDTAVILYTSGTTGRPKGAELTNSNMLTNAFVSRMMASKAVDQRKRQTILITLPLFHSYGQTVQMNANLLAGDRLVLVPRFEAKSVLDLMRREKVTLFSGVPTMYWGLLNCAREHEIDTKPIAENLVLANSGGAAMPVELLAEFEKTFGVTILEGYGLSETSPTATFNQADLPRKVGSVGLPIFGCEVKVVDLEGKELPANEMGEIVIRGHNVMKGYIGRPEATAEAIPDGWFHSGDLGRKDEEGYVFIMDRLKDLVLRGGFNVYPREIEEVLAEHPAISLAAVVGVPHDELGEEIKAYVVRRPGAEVTEEEIIAWCQERVAAYKYPRIVEFRDSLPLTATGKILKRELRSEERSPVG